MNGTQTEKLEDFFRSVAESESPLLLLDYDGTLADFRVNRFDARPWAGVRELLARIQCDGRTQLILVTGRPAGEINPMLKLDQPVEVWGLHGAERLLANGTRELDEAPPEVMRKLDELREQLRPDAFGGLIEDKPNAIVMHWRGKPPRQAKRIEEKTRALFEPAAQAQGLSLLPFESGIELRVGRDKGGAVEEILKLSNQGSPVTYVGDDLTDEPAFHAVNGAQRPHVSVLMRRMPRETAADVWLKPPEDLRCFLRRWLHATAGWESPSCAEHTEVGFPPLLRKDGAPESRSMD